MNSRSYIVWYYQKDTKVPKFIAVCSNEFSAMLIAQQVEEDIGMTTYVDGVENV